MAGITVTQGTQTNVKTTTIGTQEYQHVVLNFGTSADSPFKGTITELSVLAKGTVATGTIDTVSQLPPNYFGVTVTSGTSTLGTVKAAVAGSAIFVTDLIISVGSASNVVVGMGGTSTPLIGTLSFNANGGLAMPFRSPGSVTLGSALVFQQSANGPLSITANGFVR